MKKTIAIASLFASLFVSPLVLAETVNINTADVAALDSLDGIGEKKAEAIVAYRTEHGEFKTLEDLKEVAGIGDKLFDKIKENIALTGDAAAEAPAKEDTAKADQATAKSDEKSDTAKAETTEKSADKEDTAKAETSTESADKAADNAEVKADKAAANDEKVDEKADAESKSDKVSNKDNTNTDKS